MGYVLTYWRARAHACIRPTGMTDQHTYTHMLSHTHTHTISATQSCTNQSTVLTLFKIWVVGKAYICEQTSTHARAHYYCIPSACKNQFLILFGKNEAQ